MRFSQSLGQGLGLHPEIIGTTSLPNLSLELGLFKAQNFNTSEFLVPHLKEKCNKKKLLCAITNSINALDYDKLGTKGPTEPFNLESILYYIEYV